MADVHVEAHSQANEQIVWVLKGKMEFRLGSEQRICGQGDVVGHSGRDGTRGMVPRRHRGDRFLRASARGLLSLSRVTGSGTYLASAISFDAVITRLFWRIEFHSAVSMAPAGFIG
jgi:hypothetical protein